MVNSLRLSELLKQSFRELWNSPNVTNFDQEYLRKMHGVSETPYSLRTQLESILSELTFYANTLISKNYDTYLSEDMLGMYCDYFIRLKLHEIKEKIKSRIKKTKILAEIKPTITEEYIKDTLRDCICKNALPYFSTPLAPKPYVYSNPFEQQLLTDKYYFNIPLNTINVCRLIWAMTRDLNCDMKIMPMSITQFEHLSLESRSKYDQILINDTYDRQKPKWFVYNCATKVIYVPVKDRESCPIIVRYENHEYITSTDFYYQENGLNLYEETISNAISLGFILPQLLTERVDETLKPPIIVLIKEVFDRCLTFSSKSVLPPPEIQKNASNLALIARKQLVEDFFKMGDTSVTYNLYDEVTGRAVPSYLYKLFINNNISIEKSIIHYRVKSSCEGVNYLETAIFYDGAHGEALSEKIQDRQNLHVINLLNCFFSLSSLYYYSDSHGLQETKFLESFLNNETILFVKCFKHDKAVTSKTITMYDPLYACAARNRFLRIPTKLNSVATPKLFVDSAHSRLLPSDFIKKRDSWSFTGLKIVSFLKKVEINHDFINALLLANKQAKQADFEPAQCEAIDRIVWKFIQIAQMGKYGLTSMFNHLKSIPVKNNHYKVVDFHYLCDLSNFITINSSFFLEELIKETSEKLIVFKELSFVLPIYLNCEDALEQFIEQCNRQKASFKLDAESPLDQITFYFEDAEKLFNNNDKRLKTLFKIFSKIDNLIILPVIPVFQGQKSPTALTYLKDYLALQNKVLDNRRKIQYQTIISNVAELDNFLVHVVPIDNQIRYPISQLTMSVQQQQQVMVENDNSQNQQQETVQHQHIFIPPKPLLFDNLKNWNKDNACIDRSNVDLLLSKFPNENAHAIFSSLVGSHVNADFVLEIIDKSAVDKLLIGTNINYFMFGFSLDNLPPGFYLEKNGDVTRLVLLYSSAKEQEVLEKRNRTELALRMDNNKHYNLFTIILPLPLPLQPYWGDYRQFTIWTDNEAEQKILWLGLKAPNSEAIEQDLEVTYKHSSCLTILKKFFWHTLGPKLSNLLFSGSNPLTEKNLLQLGQLFHFSDHRDEYSNKEKFGTLQWATLASILYSNCSQEIFQIWRDRILNETVNWNEILETQEVNALLDSVFYLRSRITLQRVWGALLNAHGASLGYFKYSALWYAFVYVVEVIENCSLKLNFDQLITYFNDVVKSKNGFNGTVFLERLIYVLSAVSKHPQAQIIQQRILENITSIDWSYSGFYYACRYFHVANWYPELRYSELKSTFEAKSPGYHIEWDANTTLTEPTTHLLRFSIEHLKFSHENYANLLNYIQPLIDIRENKVNYVVTLLAICLHRGSDVIQELDPRSVIRLMNLEERALQVLSTKFISTLQNTSYHHLTFDNLFVLITELSKQQNWETFTVEFINFCAHVLKIPKGVVTDQGGIQLFQELVKEVCDRGFGSDDNYPLLLTHAPWLIAEFTGLKDKSTFDKWWAITSNINDEKVKNVINCLAYIDFKSSKAFPNSNQIDRYIEEGNSRSEDLFIQELIEMGCAIRLKIGFRTLDNVEKQWAMELFNTSFKQYTKISNSVVWLKLLNYVAINDKDGPYTIIINDLISFLVNVDTNISHNEISHILGTICKALKEQGSQTFISLPILLSWLKSLRWTAPVHASNLYNVDILETVLKLKDKEFISNDLYNLKSTYSNQEFQNNMQRLANSEIPNLIKPIVVKLYRSNPGKFDFLCKFFEHCHALSIPHELIEVLASYFEYILPTLKLDFDEQLLFDFVTEIDPDKFFKEDYKKQKFSNHLIDFIRLCLSAPNKSTKLSLLKSLIEEGRINLIGLLSLITKQEDFDNLPGFEVIRSKIDENNCKYLIKRGLLRVKPTVTQLCDIVNAKNAALDFTKFYDELLLPYIVDDKRNYSLTETDKFNLQRIINGIKLKDRANLSEKYTNFLLKLYYFGNSWCILENLQLSTIGELNHKIKLYLSKKIVSVSHSNLEPETKRSQEEAFSGSNDDYYDLIKVLVCMREIFLRINGKWANHTQMIALTHALVFDSESLIHKLRPGEGKSIVSILRKAYFARCGYLVDMYSPKESLSLRDYCAFTEFLNALNIPNEYISSTSDPKVFNSLISKTCGAITFSVIGQQCLFQLQQIWMANYKIPSITKPRIAFIDEIDQILEEKTLFNQINSLTRVGVYEYDQWAYEVIVDYYLNNKEDFLTDQGYSVTNEHLEELTSIIYRNSIKAPILSNFMRNVMVKSGTREGNDAAKIDLRNKTLVKILSAVYTAESLTLNKEYCIKPSFLKITNLDTVKINTVLVLNNNIEQEGAIFSNYIHQILCILENRAAQQRGDIGNVHVPPVDQTAASLTVDVALAATHNHLLDSFAPRVAQAQPVEPTMKYQFSKGLLRYLKIEGVTATPGNAEERQRLHQRFGIDYITKFPPHLVSKTKVRPPVFAKSHASQIHLICRYINSYQNGPILIHCKNDSEVEKLANALRTSTHLGSERKEKIYADMNKFGKTEAEILTIAREPGTIIVSSRLTRGSDFQTDAAEGLYVIMPYLADDTDYKQAVGRQGRHGKPGIHQYILNFEEIKSRYYLYSQNPELDIGAIKEKERKKLEIKLRKYSEKTGQKDPKWLWATIELSPQPKEDYIVCRTVLACQKLLESRFQEYESKKNNLVAQLTFDINTIINSDQYKNKANIREKFCALRDVIDELWVKALNNALDGRRLAEPFIDKNSFIYRLFRDQVVLLYKTFIIENFDPNLVSKATTSSFIVDISENEIPLNALTHPATDPINSYSIQLYQAFISNIVLQHTSNPEFSSHLFRYIKGNRDQSLNRVFEALSNASLNYSTDLHYIKLIELFEKCSSLSAISYDHLAQFIDYWMTQPTPPTDNQLIILVKILNSKYFNFGKPSSLEDNYKKGSLLFLIMEVLKQVREFNIGINDSSANTERFLLGLCDVLYEKFWFDLTDTLSKSLIKVLASSPITTMYFLTILKNANDFEFTVQLVNQFIKLPSSKNSIADISSFINKFTKRNPDYNQEANVMRMHAILIVLLDIRLLPISRFFDEDNKIDTILAQPSLLKLIASLSFFKYTYFEYLTLSDRKLDNYPSNVDTLGQFFKVEHQEVFNYADFDIVQNVPKNIPVSIIESHKNNPEQLAELGKWFNYFLYCRGLITSAHNLIPIKSSMEECSYWGSLLLAGTIEDAIIFFQMACNYSHLEIATLMRVYELYRGMPLKPDINLLNWIFELANRNEEYLKVIPEIVNGSDRLPIRNESPEPITYQIEGNDVKVHERNRITMVLSRAFADIKPITIKPISELYPEQLDQTFLENNSLSHLSDTPLTLSLLDSELAKPVESAEDYAKFEKNTALKSYCIYLNNFYANFNSAVDVNGSLLSIEAGFFYHIASRFSYIPSKIISDLLSKFSIDYQTIIEQNLTEIQAEAGYVEKSLNTKDNILKSYKATFITILHITNEVYKYNAIFYPGLTKDLVHTDDPELLRLKDFVRVTRNALVNYDESRAVIYSSAHVAECAHPADLYRDFVSGMWKIFNKNYNLSNDNLTKLYVVLKILSGKTALFADNPDFLSINSFQDLLIARANKCSGEAQRKFNKSLDYLIIWIDKLFVDEHPIKTYPAHFCIINYLLDNLKSGQDDLSFTVQPLFNQCWELYTFFTSEELASLGESFHENIFDIWVKKLVNGGGSVDNLYQCVVALKNKNCVRNNYLHFFPDILSLVSSSKQNYSLKLIDSIINLYIEICSYENSNYLLNDLVGKVSKSELTNSSIEKFRLIFDKWKKSISEAAQPPSASMLCESYRYLCISESMHEKDSNNYLNLLIKYRPGEMSYTQYCDLFIYLYKYPHSQLTNHLISKHTDLHYDVLFKTTIFSDLLTSLSQSPRYFQEVLRKLSEFLPKPSVYRDMFNQPRPDCDYSQFPGIIKLIQYHWGSNDGPYVRYLALLLVRYVLSLTNINDYYYAMTKEFKSALINFILIPLTNSSQYTLNTLLIELKTKDIIPDNLRENFETAIDEFVGKNNDAILPSNSLR